MKEVIIKFSMQEEMFDEFYSWLSDSLFNNVEFEIVSKDKNNSLSKKTKDALQKK